jgi:ABC-type antimicrobial peptide transport system permease subunit
VFIIFIACVNFMNLSNALSIKRAKEIGVRKVAGAARGSLIRQFIGEAFFVVFISLGIAVLAAALALPAFNEITHKQIKLPIDNWYFWLSVSSLAVLTSLLSGSYPALYLSSFKPVGVLKGTLQFGSSALWFRKGLVVFQFSLSIMLIIGTIVVSRQLYYLQSYNLGYDRENLIYVPLEGDLAKKYNLFKNQASSQPGINLVSRITYSPTSIDNGTIGVDWEDKDPGSNIPFTFSAIGYDFARTMKVEMADGRDFSMDHPSDSTAYVVNESAIRVFNYKKPIGKPLTFWQTKGTIVGVMKDVHFNSLHRAIPPMIFRLSEDEDHGFALVRTEAGKTKEALAILEKICKELNPQSPFSYQFSDEEYQKMYKSEQLVTKLANSFAFLGIFISCLGLFGLAMFTTEQHVKEIGIRKVLGAEITSLFGLLSKEILLLVTIAILIASPVAFFIMRNWLADYVYRVEISWWIFLMAGFFAMIIALLTISYQTIKALLANPIDSLRSE